MLEENTNKSWSQFEAEEMKAAELNDEELDAVAGGGFFKLIKRVTKTAVKAGVEIGKAVVQEGADILY
jgi:hypothetical protein